MNLLKLLQYGAIVLILISIHFIVSPFFALHIINNSYNHQIADKPNIGDTSDILNYPWGKAPIITLFLNLENLSIEDRNSHIQSTLYAMNWWETDKTHNLSYSVKFKLVNNSEDANIIIIWTNIVSSNPTDGGYTHINSSGRPNPLGKNCCDTYNPPYSRCFIEISTSLNDKENLYTVKHEIGHALGLKHSFNKIDFYKTSLEVPLSHDFENSELMFDYSIYRDNKTLYNNLVLIYDILFTVFLVFICLFLIKIGQKDSPDK